MTKHFLSLLELALRLAPIFKAPALKNIQKPSFVSLPILRTSTGLTITTYIAKAIDRYVAARIEESANGAKVDPKLQNIVESIFRRCIDEGEHKQVSAI